MPANILPRMLDTTLALSAWAWLPLGGLTVAGVFEFDDRSVIASAGAASVSAVWGMIRRTARNVEKRAQRVDARQAALIGALDKALAAPGPETGPHPILVRYDGAA